MIGVWWSIALTVLGGLGWLLVTVERRRAGFVVGICAQLAWVSYAVATRQWGFLGSAALFGAINTLGLLRLARAAKGPLPSSWIQAHGHDLSVLPGGQILHHTTCDCLDPKEEAR